MPMNQPESFRGCAPSNLAPIAIGRALLVASVLLPAIPTAIAQVDGASRTTSSTVRLPVVPRVMTTVAQETPDAHPGVEESLSDPRSGNAMQGAELNYRARRYDVALEQFGVIAAMQDHPFAWLRIGNIWHRRGEVGQAFDAYTRARDAASTSQRLSGLRDRATMNLALLGLDQAQIAVEEMHTARAAAPSQQWQQEVAARLDELRTGLPASQSVPLVGAESRAPGLVGAASSSMGSAAALRRRGEPTLPRSRISAPPTGLAPVSDASVSPPLPIARDSLRDR